ncbi:MAG: PAS domain S-box protein [Chloroflexaceae bacterium]|nr:PAS domain S-box protein [Chloroflexaceae bacterium]
MLANQHWCAATSQSLADAIGKCDEELFPPETVAYWQELTRQVHATGKAVEREEQFPHDDGLHTYVSSQFPLYNEQGELYAIGGIANDITMRKRNEEALRAMNQRLERTFAATPLAMIEINRDGLIRRWNQSAERIFGWSADQALGKHIFPLVVPGFAQEQMQPVLDALLSGQMRNSRNQNITRDGRIITCQWYNAILYDEHETVVGILSQAEDVTAQVERESELQTFLALAHNAPDGIVVSTLNNVVTYLNPAFRQMTGYDESAIGQHIYTFYDEPTEKLAAITEEVRTSQTWQGNITYRRRDGSAFVGQLSIFLIFDHEQKPTAIARIIRDLTEQQQIEAERATLQQQVIDAQQAVLRELSTPLLPIADGVVIMPLIGTIDTQRAQQMMETLLEGVAQYHAKMAILDITGVKVVDTQVANVFIGSAQAVRLLGAQVMITGIQPQIAQTLVQLGADLRGIITRGSLQAGITYALGR